MTRDICINLLKEYLYERDTTFEQKAWPARLREYDNNPTKLLSRIFIELDCSRKMPDNITPIVSTNSLVYRRSISEALWLIELMDDTNELYDRLAALHALNLSYEKDNPPPVYKNKKDKVKSKSTKSKQTDLFEKDKPKATRFDKFTNLKLNLKFNNLNAK